MRIKTDYTGFGNAKSQNSLSSSGLSDFLILPLDVCARNRRHRKQCEAQCQDRELESMLCVHSRYAVMRIYSSCSVSFHRQKGYALLSIFILR